jgi:spore germination protein KA
MTMQDITPLFGESGDFNSETVAIGGQPVGLCFLDGITSSVDINRNILEPLMRGAPPALFAYHSVKRPETAEEAAKLLIGGHALLFYPGQEQPFAYEVKGFPARGIAFPQGENVIKGARDAFGETLRLNTGLVRRKIGSPDLRFREMAVGYRSQTRVAVVYLEGHTPAESIAEVTAKLEALSGKTDGALTSAIIEEALCGPARSPFPRLQFGERTDRFCIEVLSGRVGVLIDGLCVAYTLPATLPRLMRAAEDFSLNSFVASVITLLRYFALIVSVALPGGFLAVALHHQEMIPYKMVRTMLSGRAEVPFPTFVELLFMMIVFEVIIEAGIRMPGSFGGAVSIVGGLVMGQAAVMANFVSPVTVIIVAFTGIAGFTSPNQDFAYAARFLRVLLIPLCLWLGLFGLAVGMMLLIWHLAGIVVCGIPYLSGGSILRLPYGAKEKMG